MAAADWGEPGEVKRVRPPLNGSDEEIFHSTALSRFFIPLQRGSALQALLAQPRLKRAIGVIHRPETERQSHYSMHGWREQLDAVIHWDDIRVVEPLKTETATDTTEAPETYPSGV